MRSFAGFKWPLIIALLGLPAIVHAQKFQEPTKEELQMTSDPKAPGAPAVFLYREEKTDNSGHFVSSYARIKVLTEKGKEWATVEVPYDPKMAHPPIVEARTIHSDGAVIPLTGKATDLLVFKSFKSHLKAAVFTLPSVEVGSILEYRWTVPLTEGTLPFTISDSLTPLYSSLMAKSTPDWAVQQEIFVHKASFYFNPFTLLETGDKSVLNNVTDHTGLVDGERATNLLYTQHLPPGSQVNKSPKGEYFLEIADVPALPQEADSPPAESLAYRVKFYYSPYNFPDVYWESETKRWSKQLEHFADQTSTIKDAARGIFAADDAPEAKARKLYDFVETLDNTDFTRAKSEAERKNLHLKKELKTAEDVLGEKSGSSNGIAALYLALARAAGLDATGMLVSDRSQGTFDPNYLSLDQLDDLLVVLRIDGKDIYLDPGEKLSPFGQLHWSHELAGGLRENSKGPVYTPPNSTKDAITAHTADLTVDANGAVTGTIKILMNGPEALHWRQLNLTTDPPEVLKQFNESLHQLLPNGLSGEVDKLQGLDTSAGYLSATAKVSGQLGSATGKRIMLPAFFFSQGARPQFVSAEKRETAVDLHYAEQVIDDVVYHLPAGFTVESAPPPVQLPWPDHAALVVKTQASPGAIDIKHIYARAFTLLDPKEYPALRDYYQKLATTDQQQLVLAAGAAAGN